MISLGRALKQRGHQVAVVTTADGEPKVRESRLRAHCVLSQKEYDLWRSMPREEDPGRENLKAWVHIGLPAVAETIRFVWRNYLPGKSVGLAPALAGAGFAFLRERLQIPVLEIQYAPRDHEDGGQFDSLFGTLINDIRGSIDLPPLQGGWLRWLLTHDRVVGLYPRWFFDALDAPPLAKVVPTNYLFEPQDDLRPLPEALERFLDAGPPPLVVTFGTYASSDANLYRHMLDACTALGERLVVITRYAEQLPVPLPPNCIVVPYVSLKRLFV